ncbi:hypothetical protein D3C87_1300050 [compost metagenome]
MQQLVQRALVVRVAQVELAGPLAAPGIDHQRRDSRQVRRRHQQHVGAVRGQRAPRHRAGDDPREVEHAHAGQRAGIDIDLGMGRQRRQGLRRRLADLLDGHRRQPGNGLRLRMRAPGVVGPHGGHHEPGVRGGGLECLGLPAAQRRAHRILVMRALEQAQHAVAVMGEIGVQPDPAPVAARVQAGDLVPELGGGPAVHAQVALAAELRQRVAHVHRHVLPAARALRPERRRGQRGRPEAGLRRRAHREARWQHRVRAGQRQVGQRLGRQAGAVPEAGQGVRRQCGRG